MNVLDIAISCGLTPKRAASTHGGEYASPCPMCGGDDRFRLWPEQGQGGSWWCRACGKGGDAIQLLIEARGLKYLEACRELGTEPTAKRPQPTTPAGWSPRTTTAPADLWQTKAEAFVEYAHSQLLSNNAQLAWLAVRGITTATAVRYRLGWSPQDLWRAKPAWGVADNKKKLWLPAGLVIPYIIAGRIRRIRIRRWTVTDDFPARYIVVPGSDTSAMIIPTTRLDIALSAIVVVESELDALLISQDAGDIVGVIALGNSSSKPDEASAALLRHADSIQVALDFDAAGAKCWPWWRDNFATADRCPTPSENDPGDYRTAGGDIRAWLVAVLPPAFRARPATISEPDRDHKKPGADLVPYFHFPSACRVCGKKLNIYDTTRAPARIPCAECVLADRYATPTRRRWRK